MKCINGDVSGAVRAYCFDYRIKGEHGYREVGGMGGYTVFAPSEDGMQPVLAVARIAA